jgi:hypothetical protein
VRRAALAGLAAVALAVAGCGGGGGDEEEATALLKRGFATDVESGVLTLDAEVQPEGIEELDGPLRLTLEGPFEAAGGPTELPDLDMDFRASGAGREFGGRVVLTPENAWVEYRGATYEAGEELWARVREALREQDQEQPETFAEAGIDPLDWVDDAESDGEEEVAGAQTTKVTAKLDVEAMLRDFNRLSSGERVPESALRQVEDAVQDVDPSPG